MDSKSADARPDEDKPKNAQAEEAKPESERFPTVTTVLIAIVSTAIALVASQAAVANGNTTEAQHNGVLAKINLERVDGRSRVEVARNQRAFDRFRFNRALWSLTQDYIAQAEAAGQSPHGTRLRQEAAGVLEESDNAWQFLNSGYLITDENGDYVDFDVQTYLSDEQQTAAITQDIDSADNFEEADKSRNESLAMNLSLIVLFVSVLFLTWAQITRSALRWMWLAAGVLVALGVGAGYLVAGMAGMLGL